MTDGQTTKNNKSPSYPVSAGRSEMASRHSFLNSKAKTIGLASRSGTCHFFINSIRTLQSVILGSDESAPPNSCRWTQGPAQIIFFDHTCAVPCENCSKKRITLQAPPIGPENVMQGGYEPLLPLLCVYSALRKRMLF